MVRVVAVHDRVVDEHRLDEINRLSWLPVGQVSLVPRSQTTRKALGKGCLLPADEETAKWAGLPLSKVTTASAVALVSDGEKASKKGADK
jgi:hypothetical protein